jgi:glycerol-3-phosphate dehydrogenase
MHRLKGKTENREHHLSPAVGPIQTDVVVIGGGITGAAISRELSRYKLDTILVEKSGELCAGSTKATLGNIYTGLYMVGSLILKSVLLPPGTPISSLYNPDSLKMRWCEEGFKEWPQTLHDLQIKHVYLPLHIVAITPDQVEDLNGMRDLGRRIGGVYADFQEVGRDEILAREPYVNKNVIAGLYAEGNIIEIFPPEAAIALVENAVQNGLKVMLDAEVTGISENGEYQLVQTRKGLIQARFVINAAGGCADKIAKMVENIDWGLQYRKTQFIILDRRASRLVNGIVRFPNRPGLIQVVMRREDNVLIECGPYDLTESWEDTETHSHLVANAMAMAKSLIPDISENDIINTFTGVRVFNTRDVEEHIIEFAKINPRFLNVVIRLPGFIGALPMARHVVKMLSEAGLQLTVKHDFNPYRRAIPRFRDLSNDERRELISKNPLFGHVVCRCETVTEGEIIEAIKRGAITEEGIKMRTRAGMGRCKRGFCGPRVIDILARERQVSPLEVTKRGVDSPFLLFRSKELLQQKGER